MASRRVVRLARLLRLLRLGAILTRLMQRERALTSGTAFRFAALLTLLVIVIAGRSDEATMAPRNGGRVGPLTAH